MTSLNGHWRGLALPELIRLDEYCHEASLIKSPMPVKRVQYLNLMQRETVISLDNISSFAAVSWSFIIGLTPFKAGCVSPPLSVRLSVGSVWTRDSRRKYRREVKLNENVAHLTGNQVETSKVYVTRSRGQVVRGQTWMNVHADFSVKRPFMVTEDHPLLCQSTRHI